MERKNNKTANFASYVSAIAAGDYLYRGISEGSITKGIVGSAFIVATFAINPLLRPDLGEIRKKRNKNKQII